MNLNFDYSIIKNRTNTNNDFSGKDFNKINNILNTKYSFGSNRMCMKIWNLLMLIGNDGHFDIDQFLASGLDLTKLNNKNLKKHAKFKIYRSIIRQLNSSQWKYIILNMLSLLGISHQEVKNKGIKYEKQQKIATKKRQNFKRISKKAIRLFNLAKVENEFFNNHKVVILTKWQIKHINFEVDLATSLEDLKRYYKNPNPDGDLCLGAEVLFILSDLYQLRDNKYPNNSEEKTFVNKYCYTKYSGQDFQAGNNYIKTTHTITKLKSSKQWYDIFIKIIKNTCNSSDIRNITEILKGNNAIVKQYNYQLRILIQLNNEGAPIKGYPSDYFKYDCPKRNKSKLVPNPARKFYKHNKSWRNKELHKAIEYIKSNK